MATLRSDIIIPEVFTPYVIEQTTQRDERAGVAQQHFEDEPRQQCTQQGKNDQRNDETVDAEIKAAKEQAGKDEGDGVGPQAKNPRQKKFGHGETIRNYEGVR